MTDDINQVDDKQNAKARKKAEREAKKEAKRREREAKKAENASAQSAGGGGGGPIKGITQWLADSYNGLFKIVIQPQLPKPRMILLLLGSFIFGMIWAYLIVPTNFFDASPSQLSASQRDQYLKLVAGSNASGLYAENDVLTLLRRVEEPAANVSRLAQQESGQVQWALQQLEPLAAQAGPGETAPSGGDMLSSVLTFLLAVVLFVLVINVIALVWGLLLGGYWERLVNRLKPKTEADLEAERVRQDIRRRKELQEQMEKEAAQQAAASGLGAPIMQRISPYKKGRPYDDSFAIEDANDMFLGECGATVAKTIGDNELTAIEIWLFDKEDFVRTLSKLLVSEHAFNDPALRSEMDAKIENPAEDIVVIAPGATIQLETKMIVAEAKVADLKPGTDGSLPPNSHFEEITLQMSAWERVGSASAAPAAVPPVPAAAGGLPDLSSYEIGPPPEMPAAAPKPPASGGLPDLSSYEIGPPPEMPAAAPKPPASGGLPDLSSYEIGPPPEMPSSAPTQPGPAASPAPLQNFAPPPTQPPPAQGGTPPAPGLPLQPPPSLPNDDDDDDPFGGTGDFTPLNR